MMHYLLSKLDWPTVHHNSLTPIFKQKTAKKFDAYLPDPILDKCPYLVQTKILTEVFQLICKGVSVTKVEILVNLINSYTTCTPPSNNVSFSFHLFELGIKLLLTRWQANKMIRLRPHVLLSKFSFFFCSCSTQLQICLWSLVLRWPTFF